MMPESRFPRLSFSDHRLKLRSRESFCNEGLSFLALLWGFGLLLKVDRRDLKFRGRVASLCTELPRRVPLGNPYSTGRPSLMRNSATRAGEACRTPLVVASVLLRSLLGF